MRSKNLSFLSPNFLSHQTGKFNTTPYKGKGKKKKRNFYNWQDFNKKKKLTSFDNTNDDTTAKKTMQKKKKKETLSSLSTTTVFQDEC